MQSLFLQGMGSLKLGPDTGTQGWSQSGGTICSKGLPPSRSHAISAGHPFISPKPMKGTTAFILQMKGQKWLSNLPRSIATANDPGIRGPYPHPPHIQDA